MFNKIYFKFLHLKRFSTNTTRRERIRDILNKTYNPIFLEVTNESYKHNVPSESETHFKVIIVSDNFKNKSTIENHKNIYKLFADEMGEKKDNKLHALSLITKSPEEWENYTGDKEYKTPNCMGGKKN